MARAMTQVVDEMEKHAEDLEARALELVDLLLEGNIEATYGMLMVGSTDRAKQVANADAALASIQEQFGQENSDVISAGLYRDAMANQSERVPVRAIILGNYATLINAVMNGHRALKTNLQKRREQLSKEANMLTALSRGLATPQSKFLCRPDHLANMLVEVRTQILINSLLQKDIEENFSALQNDTPGNNYAPVLPATQFCLEQCDRLFGDLKSPQADTRSQKIKKLASNTPNEELLDRIGEEYSWIKLVQAAGAFADAHLDSIRYATESEVREKLAKLETDDSGEIQADSDNATQFIDAADLRDASTMSVDEASLRFNTPSRAKNSSPLTSVEQSQAKRQRISESTTPSRIMNTESDFDQNTVETQQTEHGFNARQTGAQRVPFSEQPEMSASNNQFIGLTPPAQAQLALTQLVPASSPFPSNLIQRTPLQTSSDAGFITDGDDELDSQDPVARLKARFGTKTSPQVRQAWNEDENKALLDGVRQFGTRWSLILRAYGKNGQLGTQLSQRSAVNIKDRARNMKLDMIRYVTF